MERNDSSEEIRNYLLETNPEFREIARQHHEFDVLAKCEQDEIEEHRLKKLKLQLKDQMEGMVARYKNQVRVQTASSAS